MEKRIDDIAVTRSGTIPDKPHKRELLEIFLRNRTPACFEPLVAAHIGQVRRIVFRIVLCSEDTEDLVQETFIRAYEKIDHFKGKSEFSTWVCRIGVNLAISFLRKKTVRKQDQLPENLEETEGQTPHQAEETRRELERIHHAIAGLPEKLRAVMVLTVIEEMKTDEIASILNCASATVYWRLHRARKLLAKQLEVIR